MAMRPRRFAMLVGQDEKGFTLVELLVASVVFVITIGVLLAFMARNEKAREASYHILESRQNARSALEFMVTEIRMAGSGITVEIVTSTATGDSLILYPVNPDTVGGRSEKVTLLGQFSDVETTVRQPMPNASSVTKVESTDGFAEGDLVVITNGSFANLFEVTSVQESARILQHNPTSPYNQPGGHKPWPPGGYAVGSRVFKVDLVTYYISRDDTTRPVIMRQVGAQEPRVISDHINLLEMQYELEDQTVVTMPDDPSLIRKVIVTVEAASNEPSKRHVTRLVSAAKPRCL